MGAQQDRSYFRERAIEERDAAAEASCMVKDVHLELAELYEELGSGESGDAPGKPGEVPAI